MKASSRFLQRSVFSNSTARFVLGLGLAGWVAGFATAVQGQTDDFDDGNDDSWFHYDPRGGLGLGQQAFFSFPSGGYRITTPITPDLNGGGANPGRAGAVREDVTYTDFYISVDIVDWDDTTRQAFGLLARVSNPGFQTTTGYAFTYERGSGVTPTSGDTDISVINGEAPNSIEQGESGYHLDPAKDYRFVFIGRGPDLEARIYVLPDVINPVLRVTATDSSHPSGFCGLVTFDNTGGMGVTDCTFDNYFAGVIEPPRMFLDYNRDFDEVIISWATNNGPFRLECTSDLIKPSTWVPVDENFIFPFGNRLQYTTAPENEFKVFRLVQD